MPLFGQSSPKPSSPWSKPPAPSAPPARPGWGLFESLGLKSTPRKEGAAAPPAKPPGLFGPNNYSPFKEQKEFARRAPYEPLPGTSRPITREERVQLVEDIEKWSKEIGKPYGLSKQDWPLVKQRIQKEMYQHSIKGEVGMVQELQRKIQQYEKWIRA